MLIRRSAPLGLIAAGAALVLTLTACGGNSTSPAASGGASGAYTKTTNAITVLIGSSGAAETSSVQAAVAAWAAKSGISAKVQVASDLTQEASQGFASGSPADLLYVSTDQFSGWAKAGNLEAYGDQLANKADFYPNLVSAFTYNNQFYCAPKDFSTLALVVNTDKWKAAGLTDADYPTTWAQLESISQKLVAAKQPGLVVSNEIQRLGVFVAQNGGSLVSADGKTATVNSDANVAAYTFAKKLLTEGAAKLNSDVGAGWGGEALGKGLATMVIEGNWITGVKKDYPTLNYKVVELPAGTQKGTLEYTNCWGMSKDGKNKGGALDLVNYLTTTQQQLQFAKDFGVMPSVKSAASDYKSQFPEMTAFLAGADYAQNLPAQPGVAAVLADLNSQMAKLKTSDPKSILDTEQSAMTQALAG